MDSRAKGRAGQGEFANLLRERDWLVTATSCGLKQEDIVANDQDGCGWSWEVKKCRLVDVPRFVAQARRQAESRRLRWALGCHLHGTSHWLVLRQGYPPTVWKQTRGGSLPTSPESLD